MSLHSWQQQWMSALYAAPEEAAPLLQALPAGMERYCNNLLGNLGDTLAQCYPTVLKLVGERFFRQCARAYVRQTPSLSGDLHEYGGTFPQFLSQLPATGSLPWLEDVAQLEWMQHLAFHAVDTPPLDMVALNQALETEPDSWCLVLVPGLRLMRSAYPVYRIWHSNQPDQTAEDIDLSLGGENLVVWRQQGVVQVMRLDADLALWLGNLGTNPALAVATRNTQQAFPDFDIQQALALLLSEQMLHSFSSRALHQPNEGH